MGFDVSELLLPEVWAGHARNRPDHLALVCGSEKLSWGGFNIRMNRLANALIADGVSIGDKVAVVVSSSTDACIAMFGTVKAGAVLVPIAAMLTGMQIRTILNDCGASHVICSADLRHLVDEAATECPSLRRLVATDFEAVGWVPLAQFWDGVGTSEPGVALRSSDVFSIMYSSGTTGAPKGVIHTHAARTYFCVSNGLEMGYTPAARGLVTTALYTAGTWLVVMPTLFVGGTLHIHSRYDGRRFVEALAAEQISHTFAVPSQLRTLMAERLLEERSFTSLKVLLSAGSPLQPDEKRKLRVLIGERFYELYGFTEGGSALLRPEDQDAKPLSVGKPLIGQEIVTIGFDDHPCAPDVPGEIVMRGPGLLSAYHARVEQTREAIWRDRNGRSFVRSGDVGRIDPEGFVYVVDRKKDMIISGGLNVFPADIEAVLSEHPDVNEACVIGIEDDKWGETPLALVVVRRDGGCDPADLALWANARLAKHQRISRVVVRDVLPRNALGKVLKRELRLEYGRGARIELKD